MSNSLHDIAVTTSGDQMAVMICCRTRIVFLARLANQRQQGLAHDPAYVQILGAWRRIDWTGHTHIAGEGGVHPPLAGGQPLKVSAAIRNTAAER
jgi:hypothetical protein